MNLILNNIYFWDIFFLLLTLNASLYYTYFWQLKEYRLDRILDFIGTPTGRKRLLNWDLLLRILLLLFIILAYFALFLTNLLSSISLDEYFFRFWKGFIIYPTILAFLNLLDIIYRITQKRFYRPSFSAKAILIVFLTMLIASWPLLHYFYPDFNLLRIRVHWSVSFLIFPIINALVIAFLYPITAFSKSFILKKARRKMADFPNLKVIAITGSYGKSSTKEFLAHILACKFKVLKTPGNTNTEIGVARIIINYLRPEHEVFIVEAGAYKMGEIRKIAHMIGQQIAIITAVKDSHLSLFGSLENIKLGKFELIETLPPNGIAVFNYDNEGSRDLCQRAEKHELGKIIRYGSNNGTNLKATNVKESINFVEFDIEEVHFKLPVAGKHNVENFLGAACVAREMGIELEDMANVCSTVKLREHTLSISKVSDDFVILDDTYNANPDGVVAALNYLNLYKGFKKIVVFPGMLELGERTEAEHQRIAEQIVKTCDFSFFISNDFKTVLTSSLAAKKYSKYEFITGNQRLLFNEIKRMMGKNKKTVILFISRGSEQVIRKLKNEFKNN